MTLLEAINILYLKESMNTNETNEPSPFKRYLGDSVYVDFASGQLILTTENGAGPSNTIVLEQEVYDALTHYVSRVLVPTLAKQKLPLSE
jgi:hypothetical protein